jgi:hypothetical protein
VHRFRLIGLLAVTGGFAAACGSEKPVEPPVIPTVLVNASDFSFQMPDTLVEGVTSFRLTNAGQEMHHLTLLRLGEGQTMADLQTLNLSGPLPAGMVFAGGPNAAGPNGAIEAIVDLKPGNYVAICAIPSPDGVVHMAKGMVKGFVVTPKSAEAAAQPAAVPPTPDMTIALADYSFAPSVPVTAGRHVIRVDNNGTQWHELVFLKLDAGKTLEDIMKWEQKPEGPPPASPVDGVSPLSPGETNTVTVNLTPGEYVFICFLPDVKDGRPHLAHGMVQQISVK